MTTHKLQDGWEVVVFDDTEGKLCYFNNNGKEEENKKPSSDLGQNGELRNEVKKNDSPESVDLHKKPRQITKKKRGRKRKIY